MNENRIFEIIENARADMIQLQKLLTAVPAVAPESGGHGEHDKVRILSKFLHDLGFSEGERIDAPDSRVPGGYRPNLILTCPGLSDKKTFWIMTHTDIVPPGDMSQWETDPFVMAEKDGKLFGRGVEDNQQSLVASVFALSALQKAGFTPKNTVKLLFVADEETGSDYGIRYLLKHHKNLFSNEDFVLVPDAGDKEGSLIEIAEKSVLWIKFITKGKQTHGSTPHMGVNAFVAGSELVIKLNELNERYSLENKLFTPPVSTFSPTKKEANVMNINTIPGEDVFYLDSRILPEIGIDEVLINVENIIKEVAKKYGVSIRYEIVQRQSSPALSEEASLVKALKNAVKSVYGTEGVPVGIGGGTVAAHLRNAGIETVVWSTIDSTAHMPNEYCRIDNMIGDAKVMAFLMLQSG